MRVFTAACAALVLAACVPAEVARSRDGRLAYRTKNGIVVLQPDLEIGKRFDPLRVDDGKVEPFWLAWRPDGKQLAFTFHREDKKGGLGLLDPDTGSVDVLATHEGAVWFPRWSPDGSRLGYVVTAPSEWDKEYRSELRICRPGGGGSRVVARGCGLLHAWSPDGGKIAFFHTHEERLSGELLGPGALAILDLDKEEPERPVVVAFTPTAQVEFDPAGERLFLCAPRLPAVGSDVRYGLFAFDRSSRKLQLQERDATYRAASPSGKRALVLVAAPGEYLKEGEVRVSGEGIEGVVVLGKQSGDLLPCWLDEDRVGLRLMDGRIVVHRLSTGIREDVSAKFPAIEFHRG